MPLLDLQTLGRIHCGAFSDVVLYTELYNKGAFWQFDNFYGVDLRCLYNEAVEGYFAQVRAGEGDNGEEQGLHAHGVATIDLLVFKGVAVVRVDAVKQ